MAAHVLDDATYARRARELSKEIAGPDGAVAAASEIETFLQDRHAARGARRAAR